MSDSIQVRDWLIYLQHVLFIYWTCPSVVKDAHSGESQVWGRASSGTHKQATNLNGCEVWSINKAQSVVCLQLSGRRQCHSQQLIRWQWCNMLYSPISNSAADPYTTYLVSARRYGLFVILMCHVTMLRGQWEGHDSGFALLRVLISRSIKQVIVALLSATNSTSVPPTSAQRNCTLWWHLEKHTKGTVMKKCFYFLRSL